MTLEERVIFIKKSLKDMSQDEFDKMIERNGHGQIKEAKDTIFCKVFFQTMPDDHSESLF